MRRHRSPDAGPDSWAPTSTPAPGKRMGSAQLAPVQRRATAAPEAGAPAPAGAAPADHRFYPVPAAVHDEHREPVSFVDSLLGASAPGASAGPDRPVQRAAQAGVSDAAPGDVHAAAAAGIGGPAGALPFADVIQRSFGAHDLSAIQAHVGGPAAAASHAMGAEAYATGNHVAFARAPDLHTAAHEAAHVVQQRAGVQLQGGVGEVGDAYEQQADAVADAVVRGESAEHLLGAADGAAAGSGGSGVQRKEGGATGVDAPEIAAPRLIEFDDLELGDRQRRETTLWNPGDAEVLLTKTELVLDRTQQQFQVREAPTRLVPTSSSAAARMGRLVLDFVPQGEGLRTDTLRLTVRRHGASGAERTVSIALAGRARAPGQPAHAEKVARERGEQAQRDEEAATAGREKARDARIERNMEDPRPAPAGRAEPFRARLDDMRDDVREIDAKRIEGINIIEREAETYRRRQPPLTPSAWDFVRDGAILALSFASAGLARNVAALLVPVGGHKPGPLGIGVGVSDDNTRASGGSPSASRQLVQKAVEKALGKGMEAAIRNQTSTAPAAAAGSDASTTQPLSSDPTIAFFAAQRIALGDSRRDRLADLTALGPELVDMLHDENEFRAVLAILDEARAGLGTVKGRDATEMQSLATAAQWIAFVAKRDGETKAAPTRRGHETGEPRADQVTDLRPLDRRDGVIEIGFTADLAEPGVPVRIVGVGLFGVAQGTADRIRQMDLVTAGVPIRAVARRLTYAGQSIAEPSIAVSRNEVGEIEVTAGRPGQLPATNLEARYLAAKHAPERQRHAREADVRAGARDLIETELAGQRSELAKMTVETDDDAKR